MDEVAQSHVDQVVLDDCPLYTLTPVSNVTRVAVSGASCLALTLSACARDSKQPSTPTADDVCISGARTLGYSPSNVGFIFYDVRPEDQSEVGMVCVVSVGGQLVDIFIPKAGPPTEIDFAVP